MFNAISPTYDRVNRILSFGLDVHWRKKLLSFLPPGQNLKGLDLATGTCDQLLCLMKTGKFQYGMGIDLAQEMLAKGKEKVFHFPFAKKVDLKVASALQIPAEDGVFDCVTISFGIRNVESVHNCLKEMLRVLTPGGKGLILEFSLPNKKLVRFLHLLYLRRILPFVGGLVSRKKSAYTYLNQTIESFPYGDAFCREMREVGFQNIKAHPLTFGVATLYVGEKG